MPLFAVRLLGERCAVLLGGQPATGGLAAQVIITRPASRGGFRDQGRAHPECEDIITNVWSPNKTVTSLAALMLVDRGELDVDAPVARDWPEFASEGNQDVLVRHLMSHGSGRDRPAVVEDLYDWPKSTSRMAAQAPWWEPGTASGYHALNMNKMGPGVVGWDRGAECGQAIYDAVTR